MFTCTKGILTVQHMTCGAVFLPLHICDLRLAGAGRNAELHVVTYCEGKMWVERHD